jgi:hypothetical protein
MTKESQSSEGKEESAPANLNVLARLIGYVRSHQRRISVEVEVIRKARGARGNVQLLARKETKKQIRHLAKKPDDNLGAKRKVAKSLPGVLTEAPQATPIEEIWIRLSSLFSLVHRGAVAVRQVIAPSRNDIFLLAEKRYQTQVDLVLTCKQLISAAVNEERQLAKDAQKVQREADALARRAARQKDRNHPTIRKSATLNVSASLIEQSAAKYSAVQKWRLPLLRAYLVKAEEQLQEQLEEMQECSQQATLYLSVEVADQMIWSSLNRGLSQLSIG